MKTIFVSKELSSNLVTRATMNQLFERLNKIKDKDIMLDFKDVEFMSRSSTDEFIKLKMESSKTIKEKNMSKDIRKMLEIVSESRDKPSFDIDSYKRLPIHSL